MAQRRGAGVLGLLSEWMPVIPLFGFRLGLSPLLQWIVVPATAFGLVRWMTFEGNGGRS